MRFHVLSWVLLCYRDVSFLDAPASIPRYNQLHYFAWDGVTLSSLHVPMQMLCDADNFLKITDC